MISGPALCLYFAAIRSTTSPPSVPLPRGPNNEPVYLSSRTCPESFVNFFSLWSSSVQSIQSLTSEQRHDLARAICDQPVLSPNPHPGTNRIAADLRAVAIEISQRRTFQERYTSDLQAVLDHNGTQRRSGSVRAGFVPPPAYDPSAGSEHPPPVAGKSSSPSKSSSLRPPAQHSPTSTTSNSSSRPSSPRLPPRSPIAAPALLPEDEETIDLIRETLYAALADVISNTPSLKPLMRSDPAKAYFAAVSLAILSVARSSMSSDPDGSNIAVHGVIGRQVTFATCPPLLKAAMKQLGGIYLQVKKLADEDDEWAMELIANGRDAELENTSTKVDRLKSMLELGAGAQTSGDGVTENAGRRSPDGKMTNIANRINALAIGLTGLSTFRSRQAEVFEILQGVQK